MRRSLLIVRANLRRSKAQTAAILVLLLAASAMLNLWLILAMDYKSNFDRCHDRLNAGHVTLVVNGESNELRDYVREMIEEDEDTTEYYMDDALSMVGSFPYNEGEVNTEFVIFEKEAALKRPIGKLEIVEEGAYTSGVYLPMIYGVGGGYSVGDRIHMTIGSSEVSYTVCGFLNSAMAGSHNCSMSALLLTEDLYQELEEKGYAPGALLASVRIRDRAQSEDYEAALKNAVSSRYPDIRMLSNSYTLVSSSRYISQMICAGIVSAMAFLVLLIALVVISSNVIHYIQENMKNLGALKAIGYKSGQIVLALLMQFVGITLITAFAGIGLSYVLFPAVNDMMISQTGIPYEVRFLILPFVITAVTAGGVVALAVWLAARRIKKIEPITALRQGVQTHNFRRNHVPLAATRAPLSLALALKTSLSGIKQNITVCITMLVLSLVVVFSGVMAENMIVDMEPFIQLIVGETADSCISVRIGAEDDILRWMREQECVEKVYLYHSGEVRHKGGIALMATMSDDFSDVNNQNVCIEGRFPKYENETAIAVKYAKEKGLKVGDEITLTAEGKEAEYIISGFTQTSNNLGKDCLLTRAGYEQMGEFQNADYYINLTEGTDIDAFNEKVSSRFGEHINTSVNVLAVVEGSSAVYVSLMTLIVAAILVLSGIVVAFVLYLLVRTMLTSRKRDYGVLKALGFTTGQLILQTALCFMPAVMISTLIGIMVSAVVINPLTALFLKGIGIVKCTFAVPAGFITAAGLGLILFTFGIACLLSLGIKKITPRALLTGE
ncbi:MAG: ABC transporter permease [Dorea sp.]|nr:ABC transporter permease [Dorea sp.]